MEMMRLNKYLSETGICSRREADRLIASGKVLVDGKTACVGQQIAEGQEIILEGKKVSSDRSRLVLLIVNKPRGIVCTTSDKDRAENIVEFLRYPIRIYPVGRLDKDSEGLLLMTNQGDLVNRIMRAGNFHEKEYEVQVDREVTPEFLKKMASGVKILDTVTRPCRVEKTGRDSFRIILTQGLNRQIRRMCQALGYQVIRLKRVRIMNLKLDSLKIGEYRMVTKEEENELRRLLRGSASEPKKNGAARKKG